MVVASADTKSGRTVLISLPRNFERVPLPESSKLRDLWPSGIYGVPTCPRQRINASDRCMLNAIWTEVDDYRATNPDAYPGVAVPGRSEPGTSSQRSSASRSTTWSSSTSRASSSSSTPWAAWMSTSPAGPNGDQPLPYGKDYGNGRYSDYFTKAESTTSPATRPSGMPAPGPPTATPNGNPDRGV